VVGSKAGFEGVERALRFWLILSSIEDLERRRNPFNAPVVKQRLGVSGG